MATRRQVRAFCEKLYEGLSVEHWGHIDPELFSEIAAGDMSEEAEALMMILERVL